MVPLILADEMEADWKRVKIEQAIGDEKYGDQNTDGSHSVRSFFSVMQECGASARSMLEQAAANQWSVPVSQCKATLHQVVHSPSGKKLGYGELAAAAAKLPVPDKSKLIFKKKSEYRYIGKDLPVYDLSDITHGKAVFGMDAKVDGMVYASVEHSPVLGGKLLSFDDKEALQVPGVSRTVEIPAFKPPHAFQALGGVAVIADNTWSAFQGRKKLKVSWDPGPNASYTSSEYKQQLQATARKPGKVVRNVGDVDKGFAAATKILEADYYVPHLAHAAMEPVVAVADFRDGKCTLWAPTQNPQAVQDTVAAAVGIDKKNVICNVTLLGGGFGRKSKPDYCAEAAILSKQLGKPVKVVWTREDDIHFDYYHSVAALYMKAGLDQSGKPVAWLQRSVFPSINSTFALDVKSGSAGELGMGFTDTPYALPNHRAENGEAVNHVRIGWLRSVANIYHAFAVCSFADELAHAAGRDPKDYLLDLIGPPRLVDLKAQGVDYPNMGPIEQYPVDTARLRKVVELVAEKSGWGKRRLPKGHALGIAAHRSFLSYIATVVEVAVSPAGKISIPRVDMAVDAGMIVSPDRVRSQFEGAAVFGASLALMGEITATAGKIDQSNFNNYPVVRMNEAPLETRVYIVESDAPPAGVGEPGVPPFAPALCNTIFAATGKRIRELPLSRQKLV
jgi:isoquinoline 1-oxidoreductase beta subunit